MKRRRHTPEQIIRKLPEGEKLLGQGQPLEDVDRHLEIAESTWANDRLSGTHTLQAAPQS